MSTNNNNNNNNNNMFNCDVEGCGEKFRGKTGFVKHARQEQELNTYKCAQFESSIIEKVSRLY
jgi:hypothetical protein